MKTISLKKQRELKLNIEFLRNLKETKLSLFEGEELKKVEYVLYTEIQNEREWYNKECASSDTFEGAIDKYIALKLSGDIAVNDNTFIKRFVTAYCAEYDISRTDNDMIKNISSPVTSNPSMITLKEWAEKEGIDSSTARHKALNGNFETAQKIGRQWFISSDEKNTDLRRK